MGIFIHKNNEQLGPYQETEIKVFIQEGRITVEDLGWKEGMSDWKPLKEIINSKTTDPSKLSKNDSLKKRNPLVLGLGCSFVGLIICLFGVLILLKNPDDKIASKIANLENKPLEITFGANDKTDPGTFVLSDINYDIKKTDSTSAPYNCKIICRYDLNLKSGKKEYIEKLTIFAVYQKQKKEWQIEDITVEQYGPCESAEKIVEAATELQALLSIKDQVNKNTEDWYAGELKKASAKLEASRKQYEVTRNLVGMTLRPKLQKTIFD